ncbi:response regulator [Paenibacillus nasutitermitis]|uniref:Circadian input-output histidine kinase CikA n=1 Tax=Paenibacillus nasutitermitis TaxID=1652958 RepID=A0A917E116_9BACL|nr:response regulator [Paenibacillus nasutitermitis]GGD93324.1 histidine kinase [Paenibacillus nasutitermitis]
MKIKAKLMISFFVMIALLLIISLTGLNNFTKMNEKLDEVYSNRYNKLMIAYDLRGAVNNTAKALVNVLTVPTAEILQKNEGQLKESPVLAKRYLAEMKEISTSDTENNIMLQLDRALEDYDVYTNRVIQLVLEGKGEEAIALRQKEGLAFQETAVNLIDDLSGFHRHAMDQAVSEARDLNQTSQVVMISVTIIGLLLGLGIMSWNLTSMNRGLNGLSSLIGAYARGILDPRSRKYAETQDEFGEVAKAFYSLADDLERKTTIEQAYNKQMENETWVKTNLASVAVVLQTEQEITMLGQMFIEKLAPLTGAAYGGFYIREGLGGEDRLKLEGSYAMHDEALFGQTFAFGEGLVGQCARSQEEILLDELPDTYIKLKSGIGETLPSTLLLVPVSYQGQLLAVIELASLNAFDERQRKLIRELAENCGIVLNNLFGRIRVQELLHESQTMSEELQVQSEELMSQQEELRRSNENLEEQTQALKKSEEQLQIQQEQLEHNNDQLTQKTHQLEQQMRQTEMKNQQIEKTKTALEKQTVQLALSSKYKSEFLANMSHELRTPLNSLLILSQMLKDNKEGNLTGKQVDFATTIHSSGGDLLKLIDEILDLSKIGAGKMNIVTEKVPLKELTDMVRTNFTPVSQQKGIALEMNIEPGTPESMYTDSHRVKQILKNLFSNAFKFTQEGQISMIIRTAHPEESDFAAGKGATLALEVRDTGIGIPLEQQQMVFEAFQQVDGTTSRTYGGTGLGLAISRDLAKLLGGDITLHSEEGQGSTFTLYLPEFHVAEVGENKKETGEESWHAEHTNSRTGEQHTDFPSTAQTASAFASGEAALAAATTAGTAANQTVEDDREDIASSDRVVLIVEDDIHFARVLLDMARSRGFKGIVALQGDIGLACAKTYKPDAILLDIMLPVMDGWSVLHHLKHDADTRHIPVHVISVMDDIQQGLSMGAIAYLTKPATKERLDSLFQQIESFLERDLKHLLVVEDDAAQRVSIMELIGHDDVVIRAVSTGREALEELGAQHYDCMVLDLGLPDINGFDLLDNIRKDDKLREMPIIIYTGRELDKKEEMKLKKYAETIIIKDVKSPERLLDETTLFLHRVVADLPEEKRSVLRKLHSVETIFDGKPILIVDDDIRNVFALSSALESFNMDIHFAENGREALEMLEKQPGIKLILMDMMMPEMDGYETMRHIRLMPEYEQLPIIAITAKAMKEDRDKCIEAGASDYIAKPVNIDQLLSLMRVWLYK